jgi:ribonuclease HIII
LPARQSRPTTTYAIPAADRERIHEQLRGMGGIDEPAGPYEAWRIKLADAGSQALAILYRTGKLVVSGQAPTFDRAAVMIDAVGKKEPSKRVPVSEGALPGAAAPPETEPHIGTDEAGKGDFFGPLVTAGVYVDEKTAKLLRTLGVRDSKTVGDRELRILASNTRDVVQEEKRAVLVLAPKRYNELYQQMRSEGKNLNNLLAWTHTRVIEDLIRHGLRPKFILSDQFGNKRIIENRLLTDTRLSGIPVIQRHRAEADVAVAAASILARDAFLRWLDQTGKALGLTLPKGASPKVIETGRLLVSRTGADGLKEYAKVSFKTMSKVLAG